jgi:hypothetical protein
MLAPKAGELIQELILANTAGLTISKIVNKVYPYPVATRINQKLIAEHKQNILTDKIKQVLHFALKSLAEKESTYLEFSCYFTVNKICKNPHLKIRY